MNTIFETTKQHWTYAQFKELLETLMGQRRPTGNKQSEEYLAYAKLNLQRMHRWDKTFELREEVRTKMEGLEPQHGG